jgi:hypothetical protein
MNGLSKQLSSIIFEGARCNVLLLGVFFFLGSRFWLSGI